MSALVLVLSYRKPAGVRAPVSGTMSGNVPKCPILGHRHWPRVCPKSDQRPHVCPGPIARGFAWKRHHDRCHTSSCRQRAFLGLYGSLPRHPLPHPAREADRDRGALLPGGAVLDLLPAPTVELAAWLSLFAAAFGRRGAEGSDWGHWASSGNRTSWEHSEAHRSISWITVPPSDIFRQLRSPPQGAGAARRLSPGPV